MEALKDIDNWHPDAKLTRDSYIAEKTLFIIYMLVRDQTKGGVRGFGHFSIFPNLVNCGQFSPKCAQII